MPNTKRDLFILDSLSRPLTSIAYYVGDRLAELFPDSYCLATANSAFDIEEYAAAPEREAYVRLWNWSLEPEVRLSHSGIVTIVGKPRGSPSPI